MPGTCKTAAKNPYHIEKKPRKFKTEFHLPGPFKALERFKHIANIPRNGLESKTSLNTPRTRKNNSRFAYSFSESKLTFYASLTCYNRYFVLL